MSASFSSLPLELVEDIINHVDPPGVDPPTNHSTLAALNQTSRLLNSFTTWRLYRTPRYRYSNWPLFARTLLARKDLAALVKDLYFHGTRWDDPLDPEKFPKEVAAHYLQHWGPKLNYPLTVDASATNTATLFTADADGETDAYVEMDIILNLCAETVESIFVNMMLCYEAFDLLPAPASLPALKSLSFGYIDAVEGWAMDAEVPMVLNLLRAAADNLTRLELARVNSRLELDEIVLDKVTHLILHASALKPERLFTLLAYVPNVERLEYEGAGGIDDEWDQFDPRDTVDFIGTNCKRLKHFRMDMTGDSGVLDFLTDGDIESVKRDFAAMGVEFTLIQ